MLYALEEPNTETLRVPVIKVFDGDGFLTRIRARSREVEATVRFGFIDAPEIGQPGGTADQRVQKVSGFAMGGGAKQT